MHEYSRRYIANSPRRMEQLLAAYRSESEAAAKSGDDIDEPSWPPITTDVLSQGIFRKNRREGELPTHDSTRVQVVVASAFRQVVERHVTLGVAREDERPACV